MSRLKLNERDPSFTLRLPQWNRWYPYDGGPENAAVRHCFLVTLPIPWWVNGGFNRRTLRVTFTNVRRPDDTFHNHGCSAVRAILRNGYREEILLPSGEIITQDWLPGMVGFIHAKCMHRIVKVFGKDSYSIWFRGVVTDDIRMLKSGSIGKDMTIRVASHPARARVY